MKQFLVSIVILILLSLRRSWNSVSAFSLLLAFPQKRVRFPGSKPINALTMDKNTKAPRLGIASRVYSAIDPAASTSSVHTVEGVICREVTIDIPAVGAVTVLEATAESQESLVDMALALSEEELKGQEQKLAAGDPYGSVLWPAAWTVANYLLSEDISSSLTRQDLSSSLRTAPGPTRKPLEGLTILELGTGTGLVSIAAALAGARVIATDYEPLPLALTKYAAKSFHGSNRKSLDPEVAISTMVLDMCDHDGSPLPEGVDLVVAADIMYEPRTGVAMARRAVEALRRGSRVIVGDSPGRPGRPAFLDALRKLGVTGAAFVNKVGRTCSGPRNELICGKGSTSVSQIPQELPVAIMDLEPSILTQ